MHFIFLLLCQLYKVLKKHYYLYLAVEFFNSLAILSTISLLGIQIVNVIVFINQCINYSTTYDSYTCQPYLYFSFNIAMALVSLVELVLLLVVVWVIESSIGSTRHNGIANLAASLPSFSSTNNAEITINNGKKFKAKVKSSYDEDQNDIFAHNAKKYRREKITRKLNNFSFPCIKFHGFLVLTMGLLSIGLGIVEIIYKMGWYYVGAGIWTGVFNMIAAISIFAFDCERRYFYYLFCIVCNGVQFFLSLPLAILESLNIIGFMNYCMNQSPVIQLLPYSSSEFTCMPNVYIVVHSVLAFVGYFSSFLFLILICRIECSIAKRASRVDIINAAMAE